MFAVQLGDGLAHKVGEKMTMCHRSVEEGEAVRKREWNALMAQYAAKFPNMEALEELPLCLACAPRDYSRWSTN